MKREIKLATGTRSKKPRAASDSASLGGLRSARQGFPSVVFCDGKTPQEIVRLARKLLAQHRHLLVPRVSPEIARALLRLDRRAVYHKAAKAVTVQDPTQRLKGDLLIVTAGTADTPIAEETRVTAEVMGSRVEVISDVGVAGLHRVLARHSRLLQARVIVVVAGMDGALPSIVGGLVNCPVIAVPTSIGYGASFGGVATLLTMLNSCASGVGVVNINNGFSAGCLAHRINMVTGE
ncbi:MAG: nickel pincer cofactor biosynthesis protein LarB [Nitrospirota bacterium]|nr:nickel pincer cofactor biosynthesis protein LarB [Nitrospirota bacterium]MDP2384206.1 nickel pincer cofactor biosynthesis protein LarB [Nitrospirota bacterium]MDP3599225.1 nickel pincer cofactor biosynthesis protein LarB [Nitrospirota bacterium]